MSFVFTESKLGRGWVCSILDKTRQGLRPTETVQLRSFTLCLQTASSHSRIQTLDPSRLQSAALYLPFQFGESDEHCVVLYCVVLYCVVLYCVVLYCVVLYCVVLYCVVLYCVVVSRYVVLHRAWDMQNYSPTHPLTHSPTHSLTHQHLHQPPSKPTAQ
jgi:hypothetical protein